MSDSKGSVWTGAASGGAAALLTFFLKYVELDLEIPPDWPKALAAFKFAYPAAGAEVAYFLLAPQSRLKRGFLLILFLVLAYVAVIFYDFFMGPRVPGWTLLYDIGAYVTFPASYFFFGATIGELTRFLFLEFSGYLS